MSDNALRLRIRVQPSPRDPETLHFLLDAPVQAGAGIMRFDGSACSAPLAEALFAVSGVNRVEVDGASIHVHKDTTASWDDMKAPIAAAIRAVLGRDQAPLGDLPQGDADSRLLEAVQGLLDTQINPSIAGHGGHIAAEAVRDGNVYLRMSGGCQGCAASELTLRGGVERKLRAALPELHDIVDVTDHDAGAKPFYTDTSDVARNVPGHQVSPLQAP